MTKDFTQRYQDEFWCKAYERKPTGLLNGRSHHCSVVTPLVNLL